MRRIFVGTGALALCLAALLWTTAPINAQRGGRGGGGHAAPARVGSVHYASRPAPAQVAPARVAAVARTGAVRAEHYAGSAYGGVYRNPYRNEYFSRFRPGYLPFVLSDGCQYYGYYDLPLGYQEVVSDDGITYYFFDGVYYEAYIIGGQTVYVVVPT